MDFLLKPLPLLVLLHVLLLAVLLFLVRRLQAVGREKRELEGEERRLLGFLQMLGQAIEADYSSRKLFRLIVDGVEEVLGADGAALYLVSADGLFLVPAHLSDRCPPLHELPGAQRAELEGDPDRLASYLRLTRVPADDGLLWRSLQQGVATHVKGPPRGVRPEEWAAGEVLLAPVRHAGRELGVVAAVARQGRRPFVRNDLEVFQSMAEQAAFALGNSMIHQEASEKRRLERELRMASEVQQVLLPASDPEPTGYRIYGCNVPARIVSGDYYDYLELPSNHLGVAIADVSGKGVSAGLMMATCRSALRALAKDCDSPAKALAAVNRQLFSDMREDMFISMAYAILEDGSGRARIARAGHEAPLMYRQASEEVEVLRPGGLAIGIDSGDVFERVTQDLETEFGRGDCLLLYTDGINEAENEAGEEFGRERLRKVFRVAAPLGAEAAVSALQRELREFVQEQRQMDDITIIVIEKR